MDWKDATDRIRTADPEEGHKHFDHSATATLVLRELIIAVFNCNVVYTGDVIHPRVKNHPAGPSMLFSIN